MPRPSSLQQFINKFPVERRHELERQVKSAPSAKAAYEELRRLGYKKHYNSVVNWRASRRNGTIENIQSTADTVATFTSREPGDDDPIERTMNLANQLNTLCSSLVELLQRHEWLEPGESRLSNRDAAKILAALPSLNRAAAGTIIEMGRIRTKLDEKSLCLAAIEELRQDWERTLSGDNPELIPIFEDVSRVTRSRLAMDTETLLDRALSRLEVEDEG
jgi:hypothetical protein